MANFFPEEFKRRVSDKAKRANNFRRQKDYLDLIDNYYGIYRDEDKIAKYEMNYNLFNGRLDIDMYDDPISLTMGKEEVVLDQQSLIHYPFTSHIARALHGEKKAIPLIAVAKDIGPRASTMRKKAYNELIRESINAQIISPLREKIFQQYMSENGITDIRQLPPEEQQALQQDIQARLQARTPKEIMEYMQNSYTTPSERGAQQMVDFLIEFLDIKVKRDEGFKNAIITGEEIYYVGEKNGDVVLDVINPKHFTWLGSQNTTRYEKGDWAKYEQWFSVESSLQRHAMVLDRKKIKELEKYLEPIGGIRNIGDPKYDPIQARVMYDLTDPKNPYRDEYEKLNVSLKNDHNILMNLYQSAINRYGASYGTSLANYGIREVHAAWRDKRKLRYVKRIDEKTGDIDSFWLDEHYEEQGKDIEIQDVWVDQIWEGTKLGNFGEGIYVDIKPAVGQYRSIFDPFTTDLPYYGMAFNTHMNNSKNVSCVDLGKPFQKEIDATMANIRFDMATDIGNVFMMDMSMKPENWTWQEFMASIKTAKMAPINLNQSGGVLDANAAKAINMSRIQDIASKLEYLRVQRADLITSMLSNDARTGGISQYATNANTQANQAASYNQTAELFATSDKILERVLNALINKAKVVYKDNKHRQELIFDDVTMHEILINPDFWYEASGIKISLDKQDIDNVRRIKELALTLTQNSMSPKAILTMLMAKTPSDIKNILESEDKKLERIRAEQQQAQAQQVKAEIQAEKEKMEAKFAHEQLLKDKDVASKLENSRLVASQFERQADVNNNKIADSIEKQKQKNKVDEKKIEADKEIKEKELALKEREVKVAEKTANMKSQQNNS